MPVLSIVTCPKVPPGSAFLVTPVPQRRDYPTVGAYYLALASWRRNIVRVVHGSALR